MVSKEVIPESVGSSLMVLWVSHLLRGALKRLKTTKGNPLGLPFKIL